VKTAFEKVDYCQMMEIQRNNAIAIREAAEQAAADAAAKVDANLVAVALKEKHVLAQRVLADTTNMPHYTDTMLSKYKYHLANHDRPFQGTFSDYVARKDCTQCVSDPTLWDKAGGALMEHADGDKLQIVMDAMQTVTASSLIN
jgi:hypothetical protein